MREYFPCTIYANKLSLTKLMSKKLYYLGLLKNQGFILHSIFEGNREKKKKKNNEEVSLNFDGNWQKLRAKEIKIKTIHQLKETN